MDNLKVLIIDDEKSITEILSIILSEYGFVTKTAHSKSEAINMIEKETFDLVFLDIRLPDGNGIDILRFIKQIAPKTEVIMITAYASAETAVETIKLGAYHYIAKPFSIPDLKIIVRNVKDKIQLERKIGQEAKTDVELIGKSEAIKKIRELIEKIAPFDINVLITGESGTGKNVAAKLIHRLSQRKDKPFVSINCAALPEDLLESELFGYEKGAFTGAVSSKKGLFEIANGGTVFLDEIAEMPQNLQAKLLHFLEEKKFRRIGGIEEINVDVRIITATNKNLQEEIKKGNFREDLYYRIAGIEIYMPSLKERKEDIIELIKIFINEFSTKYGKKIEKIDSSFINFVLNHNFKGNIRELKNIVEKEIILSENGVLKAHNVPVSTDLPVEIVIPSEGINIKKLMDEIEKAYVLKALELAHGNKTKAAKLLGLNLREFRYRLEKYTQENIKGN